MREHSRTGELLAALFGVIGVGLLIGAALLHRADQQLASSGITAMGTVVDFRVERARRRNVGGRLNDPGSYDYYREPIIRFTTRDGTTVQFAALAGSSPEDLESGDQLEVVYLPQRPENAEVKGSGRLSFGAVALTIMGSAFLLPGAVMLLIAQRRWRREALAARYRRKGQTR
jgi:hypothetical protein